LTWTTTPFISHKSDAYNSVKVSVICRDCYACSYLHKLKLRWEIKALSTKGLKQSSSSDIVSTKLLGNCILLNMFCILYSMRQVRASFIVLLLTGILTSYSVSASSPDTNSPIDSVVTRDMTIGHVSAPVSIVEYASFTCGHCATFHNLVLDKLKSTYVDSGKVKFTFREVYFDKFGLAGSLIARCEQNSDFFFEYADNLFEQQRAWMKTKNEAELLTYFQNIAKEQGMSEDTFSSCLNSNVNADQLLSWYQTNAERDEIKSTPAFLINGKKYSNMSFDAMSEIIESELAKLAR